ncbi:MAG: DNA translocase FtsK [Chloroflexota bacterium]|nr:DNA translocase FtsK [Chloroflexota bacterium]
MDRYPDVTVSEEDLEQKAQVMEQTLASFRVEATVREINPGPAVTQFALEPGIGVKVRRVTELQNDLALALAVPALRIEAPIPGKSRIGIEIPNNTIATVGLREALESSDYAAARAKLPIPLGRDVNGHYQVADLAKMPHLLVAGSTGSGKSVCMNVIIAALLLNRTPDELRFVMVDPKMVEMTEYNGIPHLLAPVVTDMEKVIGILRWAVAEMERRYQLFMRSGVRNIEAYHKRSKELGPHLEKPPENIPYIVIIIDELADLMMTAPDDVENALVRLAQKARATGMHLILATQRPSVNVITGLIKANFPARIAFAVTSQIDSRVILDTMGAERLLGRGDMLYKAADSDKPQRIQGAFVSDKDISAIVSHWRILAPEPQYKPEVVEPLDDGKTIREEPGGDNLIDRARQLVREQGWASTSMLQSKLRIGYNRAARLIEALEREGIIGPQDGARRRQVIDGESVLDDYPDDDEE